MAYSNVSYTYRSTTIIIIIPWLLLVCMPCFDYKQVRQNLIVIVMPSVLMLAIVVRYSN